MTVLPFRYRPPRAPEIRFRVELVKGAHKRLFEIIPNVGGWQSWMRQDGRPLRALVTRDLSIVRSVRAEYVREIEALKADGWTEAE